MNRKAFLACVLMCVILTGCETAKKISEVIKNPDIQVGSLKEQPSEITVTLLTEPDTNTNAEGESAAVDVQLVYRKSNGRCIPYCRQEPSICRCICVTVSGRPISMTQNCCNLPPLCWPWRQTCRSIRSSASLSSSRKFPRRKKSAIWSVCRSPAFHCAH